MSKINIQGIVDDIKAKTNVYTPLIEAIVNSIQSIDSTKRSDGKVNIIVKRENTLKLDETLPSVKSFEIQDNGIGFTDLNRDSFDTFYSPEKKKIGGKGFGRFMYLKYFEDARIDSIYQDENGIFYNRKFSFGKNFNIIENESNIQTDVKETRTSVFLSNLKNEFYYEKNLETIARKLLEDLLIYFVDDNYTCPEIFLIEEDKSKKISLNQFLVKRDEIMLVNSQSFTLLNDHINENFTVKIFKVYYTGRKSKISLVAQKRAVTETSLHNYIPEFEDDFFDISYNNNLVSQRNYIIKSYVLGDYLTDNVSSARDKFNFDKVNNDLHYPFSQADIEMEVSRITKDYFSEEISIRSSRKEKQVISYVNDEAPWHKPYLNEIDFSGFPFNAPPEKIEQELQKFKFNKEQETRKAVKEILESSSTEYNEKLQGVLSKITQIGKSDLAHYVSNRKVILDIFEKLLKRRDDGAPEYEKEIHNIIFPMGKNCHQVNYEEHNLWLLDERLVFSDFVASDKKISGKLSPTEPDLLVFDKKQSFRLGENEFSNPLTIFEFKRPKRENYKPEDDPILQVASYLREIREGKYEMPEGFEKIKVNEYTPVYSYIICDLTTKIKEFALNHSLTISPDQDGYFGYHAGHKMYVEIISFRKLLKDAKLRNKIFFKKLNIE